MRTLLSILAALCLAATLAGCFALDEIDEGMAKMEKNSPHKSPKQEAGKAGGEAKPAGKDAQAAARAWWADAHTLSARRSDDASAGDPNALVRCELGGSGRFMRRSDCLSQGGRPASR